MLVLKIKNIDGSDTFHLKGDIHRFISSKKPFVIFWRHKLDLRNSKKCQPISEMFSLFEKLQAIQNHFEQCWIMLNKYGPF